MSWTAPANGGSTITSYTVTPFIGTTAQTATTVSGSPPATSTTVSGLTNGTTYTFKVTATNGVGTGPASAASNAVTPAGAATAPLAPAGLTATAGVGSVTVAWTAPAKGGSPITSYTVTPFIGATAQTATTVSGSPPATTTSITTLTNGTTYTFKVTATNAAGTGPASAASNLATPQAAALSCPCTILGQGTPATVDAGDSNAVNLGVLFTGDTTGFIGGVRFYKAATNTGIHVGSLWSASGVLLAQATFSGESASGWQQVLFSSPVAVTVGTTYVVSYLAPVGHYSVTAAAFSAGSINAAPLYGVANSTAPNGVYAYGATAVFPTGTFNATNYWVDAIFTQTVPTAPAAPTAVTDGRQHVATVSWTAPANGGSTITSYTVTPFIGTTATATTVSGSPPATSTTVSGLTNGTTYTFKVTATNGVGTGPASAASNTVTLSGITAPSAPTAVTATTGAAAATVAWTAPANGGSPITSYTVTPFIGATAQTATTVSGSPPATTTTVTGLTNGTAYTFTVAATNAIGTSVASTPSNSVTPVASTAPAAPSGAVGTAGIGSVTVTWTAPANGGSPITSYTVTPFLGATAQPAAVVSGAPPATSATFTTLTNGSTYTFTVTATNSVGTGPASSPSNPATPAGDRSGLPVLHPRGVHSGGGRRGTPTR